MLLGADAPATRPRIWPGVLEGRPARGAEAAVEAIAGALLAAAPAVERPELAHGRAGIALLLAERARRRDGEIDDAAAGELRAARRLVASTALPPGLLHGVAGVAWVTAYADPDSAGRLNATFERLLAGRLGRRAWTGDFDLFNGLVGLCVYALERCPGEPAGELLEGAVGQLMALADERPDGYAWPEWWELGGERRLGYPLGVAHGTPGAIAALAGALAVGCGGERAAELLEGALGFMLARAGEDRGRPAFAKWHFPGESDLPGRSVWCNGDPGACLAMLHGARALGRADWEQRILEIARAAAGRGPEESGVRDASLCHGEAGQAHVFHRLYAETGDERFADAARDWYERLLARLTPGEPLTSFESLMPGPTSPEEVELVRVAAPGFIAGAAGVGLALLAATGGPDPGWDRLMLAGPPPR